MQSVKSGQHGMPVNARAEHAEQRFAGPVVLAAITSVPATFLTMLDGHAATVGYITNTATMAVFLAEATVLFALAQDRRAWLRRHRFVIAVTLATIPAVLLALGPVQVLRLLRVVRVVGALRILRVRRLVKAGRILRTRAGLEGPVWRLVGGIITLASAVFVALVLADPTSLSRQALDGTLERFGAVAILGAGALLAAATFVVARYRRRPGQDIVREGQVSASWSHEDGSPSSSTQTESTSG